MLTCEVGMIKCRPGFEGTVQVVVIVDSVNWVLVVFLECEKASSNYEKRGKGKSEGVSV